MKSVRIPVTFAMWAVPQYHRLDPKNPVKITCYLPEGLGDTEIDDLLGKVVNDRTPMVEVVVEDDVFDSFIFFLKDHLTSEEIIISGTRHKPSDELFVECLD